MKGILALVKGDETIAREALDAAQEAATAGGKR